MISTKTELSGYLLNNVRTLQNQIPGITLPSQIEVIQTELDMISLIMDLELMFGDSTDCSFMPEDIEGVI